jgi:hypothetical protein
MQVVPDDQPPKSSMAYPEIAAETKAGFLLAKNNIIYSMLNKT